MDLFNGRERKVEYMGEGPVKIKTTQLHNQILQIVHERGESPVCSSSRRLANCGGATGVVGVGVVRAIMSCMVTVLVGVIIEGLIGVSMVPVEPEPSWLLGKDTGRFSGDI